MKFEVEPDIREIMNLVTALIRIRVDEVTAIDANGAINSIIRAQKLEKEIENKLTLLKKNKQEL